MPIQPPHFAIARRPLSAVGIASALVNLLYLTGSFFHLEVYDRILPSRSIPSLIALSLLALLLYAFQGAFELIRGADAGGIAGALDESPERTHLPRHREGAVEAQNAGDGLQALRDFDQVRSFLSGRRSGPRSSTCPGCLSTSRFAFFFTRSSG
ncbi:hypothetical protein F2981_23670 (plasmid) [Sinorhizobium meliloti]|nr:hypothetical protein [Sinorhizobium meliloti]